MPSSVKHLACFMARCGCSVTFLLDQPAAALRCSHRKASSSPGCAELFSGGDARGMK